MEKRLTLAIATGAVATLLLGAPAATAADATAGLPSRLRVLVPGDEMPEMFSFEESGNPGFERELIEGFCRIHSLSLEVIRVGDFEQIIPMLLRGQGDVIVGMVDTPERRERVSFSSEVYPIRHMAVTRRAGPSARSLDELRALRVGTIPGTSWEQAVVEAGVPRAKRFAFRDAELLVAGLRAGEVDAVVMTVFDFSLAKKHDPDLVAGAFVGRAGAAALALRREDARLLSELNGYLLGMRQARHRLLFKYLSEEALSLIALGRRE